MNRLRTSYLDAKSFDADGAATRTHTHTRIGCLRLHFPFIKNQQPAANLTAGRNNSLSNVNMLDLSTLGLGKRPEARRLLGRAVASRVGKVECIGVTYKGSEICGVPAMSEGDCGHNLRVGHPGGTR